MDTRGLSKFPLVLGAVKSHNSHPMNHSPNDLIMLFNDLFREAYRTVLVKGSDEPEYLPASGPEGLAQVIFAHGYYASALHEISHWCIAGEHRRTLHDYGYWYCPDGRTLQQQEAFEQVEVKPQAIEWLFSVAAGSRFHISVDNLSGVGAANEARFRHTSGARQASIWCGVCRAGPRHFLMRWQHFMVPEKPLKSAGLKMPGVSLRLILNQDIPRKTETL